MSNDKRNPIDVGTRKQLFVDDYIIGERDNVFPILNQPVKHPDNPIIELQPPQQVGGDELVITDGSVIYDEEEQLFKMWYEGAVYDWSHNAVGYATSHDGENWELPKLGVIEYQGTKDNNVVFQRGEGEMAPGVFKDPVAKNPERQYKMIYNCGDGVGVAFSPDGIRWTPEPDSRVAKISDSPHSVMWDSRLEKYVAHTRHWEKLSFPDGYGHGGGPTGFGTRVVLQSESDDFLDWTTYGVIMRPDGQDPPWDRQFYNMEWMPYEDVYFGFIAVYHILPRMEPEITPGVPWMDKVDIQLAFSRDSRTWSRAGNRQTFIPTGPLAGDFDESMVYVMQHPIVVGDEILIYYAGFSGRHWATKRAEVQGGAVGLAKLRLDGFVSMDAGEGVLTTKPMVMSGDRLVVNADASLGSLAVEVLGVDGQPVAGYSKAEAGPITDDNVRHSVTWNGSPNLHELKGKPITLRFHLDRCKLFSFAFRAAG